MFNDTPYCNIKDEEFESDYETSPSGTKVRVDRYSDGSNQVHFGGPCGSMSYDKYGREC